MAALSYLCHQGSLYSLAYTPELCTQIRSLKQRMLIVYVISYKPELWFKFVAFICVNMQSTRKMWAVFISSNFSQAPNEMTLGTTCRFSIFENETFRT